MKKNKLYIIFLLIFLLFDCTAQVKASFPVENDWLLGINSFTLFEMYKKFEENDYVEKSIEKQEQFISSLTKSMNNSELLGEWELNNSETNESVDKLSFYTGNEFTIKKYNSYLEYHYKSNTSFIYTNGKDFYFYPSVHFSFLKKIILIDDKLYFYVLKDNEWILDPIHENGKYYYVKK